MNYFSQHNHKGFTLIETLFAVLIFSAALTSLMAIAGRGIAAATTAREQLTAHYLAQEGLEVLRNIRDNDSLGAGWDVRLKNCLETDPCFINYQGGVDIPLVESCGSLICPQVYTSNGAFVDASPTSVPSGYVRTVYVVPRYPDINNPTAYTEYEAIAKVAWRSKNIDRMVSLQTIFKKWQ